MSKAFSRLLVGLMVLTGLTQAWSFSMMGPREEYQVEDLGYPDDFSFTPKNLPDEYRLNITNIYYSVAPEFTDYFGSNGLAAIDGAVAILNNLTNADSFTPDLTEFPLQSWGVNYSAQALGLFDLRSCTLEVLLERYGLTDPQEFVWTLRNRALPPGASCPNYVYTVIKRNFDPVTLSPSSYINGNLFTYQIFEGCPDAGAIAEEFLVDPLAQTLSSVASGTLLSAQTAYRGYFHRTLTRDDVGGIRYLLSTNNLNWETTPVDAFVRVTNKTAQLLYPSNLQVFAEQSLTNNAAQLTALWPGLVVTATSNFFVNERQTNVVAYFTNYYTDPVGTPPRLVNATNYTTNVVTRYVHSYGNVLTNQPVYPYCLYSVMTTNIAPSPYSPAGSGVSQTNVTFKNYVQTNCVSGSIFILPTNVCDYTILYTQLTQVVTYTNFLTNTLTSLLITNDVGTNGGSAYYEHSESIVTYFTNSILVGWPVSCPDTLTSLFEGIQKVRFIKREYDSLLGQFFVPVTNKFQMMEITNNVRVRRFGERAIFQPDIVFTADDLASAPGTWPISNPTVSRQEPNYVTATNVNNLGPGTIQPTVQFTFNKVGPLFLNTYPAFIDEATAILDFIWGSFDGTTNAPVVYPVGTDLMSLEYLTVFQLTDPTTTTNGVFLLPSATAGTAYSFQLTAIGGLTPYTWTLTPGSAGLPSGLALSNAGAITGTPSTEGVYDFSIRLTDSGGRSVDYPFTLTVAP